MAEKDGQYRRKESAFRDFISKDPSSKFPAEKNRYALYVNYGCPWAHRTILVRGLKNMDDSIIQLIVTSFELTDEGWLFNGEAGSMEKDPLYGFHCLKQLYLKADPQYEGKYTVPTLWDKKNETIVNNESSEIIRMLYSEFDEFLPEGYREVNRPGGGFLPEHLKPEIDAMNEWVYHVRIHSSNTMMHCSMNCCWIIQFSTKHASSTASPTHLTNEAVNHSLIS